MNNLLKQWPSSIYILIPTYNSEYDLNRFLPRLKEFAPKSHIYVMDDGSTDNTKEMVQSHEVNYITHGKNRGKGAALRYGFTYLIEHKQPQWILSVDADGQHAPEDLHLFLDKISENPHSGMIIGARDMTLKSMPPARIFSNKVTSAFISLLCKTKILDCQCGYRAYNVSMLKKITLFYNRFEMETEIIMKGAFSCFSIDFVNVQTLYCSSQSHISHVKDIFRWLKTVFTLWFNHLWSRNRTL